MNENGIIVRVLPGDKYHLSSVVIGFSLHSSTAFSVDLFSSSSLLNERKTKHIDGTNNSYCTFQKHFYLTGHNCGSPQYTSRITHWHETNKARGKTKTNTCKEQQDNKLEMLEQVRLGYGQPIYPYGCLMNKWVQWNTCRRHSGLIGSALISWSKALAFEPWPFSLCSVHGRDTSLIVFLFTHVQGNLTKCWEVACDGHQ